MFHLSPGLARNREVNLLFETMTKKMFRWRTNAENKNYVFLWRHSGDLMCVSTRCTRPIKRALEECSVCQIE